MPSSNASMYISPWVKSALTALAKKTNREQAEKIFERTKKMIEDAQKQTKSNSEASRWLGVNYLTYRKYAKISLISLR